MAGEVPGAYFIKLLFGFRHGACLFKIDNMYLKSWIDHSNADYYTMFINAWIPFNAWYQETYYDKSDCNTDKKMIEQVKSNDNKYKNKLKNLLAGRGEEVAEFRFHLSQLYEQLESHTIPDGRNRLSFHTIWAVDSNLDNYAFDHGTYSYKFSRIKDAKKGAKQYRIEVINKNTGASVEIIELFKKELTELDNESEFVNLRTSTMKSKVRECLSHVLRHQPANFVIKPTRLGKQPSHSLLINEKMPLYLSDDIDLDAKAIIQLIYQLRCIIFHGDLEPSQANMKIYEHLYHVQKILIKELI